jgi:hypothetical protein
MRWCARSAVVSCLAMLGCVTPGIVPPEPPADSKIASFSKSVGDLPGAGEIREVDNHNLTSPNTNLYVGGGAIRGTIKFGVAVQVSVRGEKAQGTVGNAPFACVVEAKPDGSAHVIAGTTSFRTTDFKISLKQISGRIAGVTYNMTWTGERYEDRVDPGGFAALSISAVMSTWTNTEVACVLSLLLTPWS